MLYIIYYYTAYIIIIYTIVLSTYHPCRTSPWIDQHQPLSMPGRHWYRHLSRLLLHRLTRHDSYSTPLYVCINIYIVNIHVYVYTFVHMYIVNVYSIDCQCIHIVKSVLSIVYTLYLYEYMHYVHIYVLRVYVIIQRSYTT